MSQYPRPRRARRISEEEAEARPSAQELGELQQLEDKQWPVCRNCGVRIYPGKPCELSRCPWQRDRGQIVGDTRVGRE